MPRRPRIHLDNGFYHVTLRGNHQQPIFDVEADRLLLNRILGRVLSQSDARVHAYCWMTNHIHLLVQVGTCPLGVFVRQVASNYARAYQRKLSTTGHLFERRYHAKLVGVDEYLLVLLRYIHLNPVDVKLVRSPSEYRWSSHLAYAGFAVREPWLTTDFILRMFAPDRAGARAAYRQFVADGDPAWQPEDEPTALELSLLPQPGTVKILGFRPPPAASSQSFDSLLAEACARFGIQIEDLLSASRDVNVVYARGWIGREAVNRRIANLSEVARALGRDRATLRYAMRRLGVAAGPPLSTLKSGT
jgi:REP element-mobilizing transposase RayT